MDRRTLVSSLALGIAAMPWVTYAQSTGKVARVGILGSAAPPTAAESRLSPWLIELRSLGWIEGQNMIVERRYADGKPDLMPGLAQELVHAKVDVIVTFSSSDTAHAWRLTSTTPIVMVFNGMDPVEEGFIASFARPGGNVTGVSRMLGETRAKRLELIKAMLPSASRIAVLAYPQGDAGQQTKFEIALRSAARAVQVEVQFYTYKSQDDLVAAFPAMASARTQAFLLEPTFQTFANRSRIAELALTHRLPGVFTLRDYAVAGGLMSYGPDWSTILRQHARQVDRILRGANPGHLPMEQPTRFELVINLTTAKALGLTVPQALQLRADELIH